MKTREWLLIIFIVILVQFIIQVAAHQFGDSEAAINYISFTGTIVSIILAILAIVYSYVQSITQQNSSNTIAKQVDKLIEVTNNIGSSNTTLEDSLKELYEVKNSIQTSIQSQENIHQTLRKVDEKVEHVADFRPIIEDLITNSKHQTTIKSKTNSSLDCTNLFEQNGCILSSLLIFYGFKNNFTVNEILDKSVAIITEDLSDEFIERTQNKDESFPEKYSMFIQGHLSATLQTLAALSFAQIGDLDEHYTLTSEFQSVCKVFLDENKGSEDFWGENDFLILYVIKLFDE